MSNESKKKSLDLSVISPLDLINQFMIMNAITGIAESIGDVISEVSSS